MNVTEALDQIIDTGKASSEAVVTLFEVELADCDVFAPGGFRLNWYGRDALERRRKERT